jgi:hypothetical protein
VSTLQSWTEAAWAELGLDPATVEERLILNLTRVVAHPGGPARRAADRVPGRPGGRPWRAAGRGRGESHRSGQSLARAA